MADPEDSQGNSMDGFMIASQSVSETPTTAVTASDSASAALASAKDMDMAAAIALATANPQKFVAEAVQAQGLVVFAKTYCPPSTQTINILSGEKAEMKVYQLDNMGQPSKGPVQQELEKLTGLMRLPQVFVSGKYIGQLEEIEKLETSKMLKETLGALGATFKPVQT